jgi:hypothetical protein
MTDRRRHQRPLRPKQGRQPPGNGPKYLAGGILQLCDDCSTDHAREWYRDCSGGWKCDRCWSRRFG